MFLQQLNINFPHSDRVAPAEFSKDFWMDDSKRTELSASENYRELLSWEEKWTLRWF